jgi:hypothetical protein
VSRAGALLLSRVTQSAEESSPLQKLRLLLRYVDLLFLIYVTEEIDQATDERYSSKPKRHPAIIVTTLWVRKRNKLIEVKDRPGGGQKSDNHRKYVFQAFHFEPPASKRL